jgi:hypothetical protein
VTWYWPTPSKLRAAELSFTRMEVLQNFENNFFSKKKINGSGMLQKF